MKDKEFYKSFFSLYVALVLQNVVTLSVNLADNIMLGAYGEMALSGVTAVNQIQFLYQEILLAFGDGMVTFCSQYWGQKRTEPMKKIIAVAMRFGVAVSVILFVLMSCFPAQAMLCFTTDEQIIAEGVEYLRVIRFTYLFFAVSQMLLAALRSTEVVRIALHLSVMALVVNCGINYVLIFGHFGAPEMGVTGAAIGTLAARILECGILVYYVARREKALHLKIKDFFAREKGLVRRYLQITVPLLLVSVIWGINTAMQTVVLGHMETAAIAANSASSNLFLMIKSAAVGAASAGAILIGKTIGMGDMKLVQRYAVKMQKMFVAMGVLGGISLYFLRIPILSLYDLSPEAMRLANHFMMIQSFVFIFTGYQMPTNSGVIRGGGSVKFCASVDVLAICLLVIPLSCYMAFVAGASPEVVVLCLNSDQFVKGIPVFFKINFGHWIKQLT